MLNTRPLLGVPLQALVRHKPTTLPLNACVIEATRTLRDQSLSSIWLLEKGQLPG